MVCAYLYEIYTAPELYSTDLNYSADQIDYALKKPVQLHYATGIKPWNTPASAKSQIWFQFLFKTPFATDYLEEITPKLRIANSKTLCKFKVPFSKRNFVEVKKIRI